MECHDARELLSPYLDHALDAEGMTVVEEHLEACQACREELQEIQAAVEAVRALPKLSAPPGFLEAVKLRLPEEEPFWKRVLRRLFMPLRLKLPLELAGLLTTAALIVIAFRVMEGPNRETASPVYVRPVPLEQLQGGGAQAPGAPSAPSGGVAGGGSAEFKRGSDAGRTAMPRGTAALRKADQSSQPAQPPAAAPGGARDESAPVLSATARPLPEQAAPVSATATLTLWPLSPERGLGQRQPAPGGETASRERLDAQQGVLARVEAAVTAAGGTFLSAENRLGTDRPQVHQFRIPTENYETFLSTLRRLGALQEDHPGVWVPAPGTLVDVTLKVENP